MAKVNVNIGNYFPTSELLEIDLINSSGVVSTIAAGFNELASAQFDNYDIYAPPGEFEDAGIRFINNTLPNWNQLFVEHRPFNNEGQSFDIQFRNNTAEAVKLKVKGVTEFTEDEIYLADLRIAAFHNLKEKSEISFEGYVRKADFKLLIGNEKFIQSEIEKLQPTEYMLYQNYPNPFNPKTVIRYSIPYNKGSNEVNVSLKIYDIIGSEILTLVNEKQSGGYHEIEFDASKLSSGVYMYSLSAGEFKSVKKMILLK